MTNKSCRICVKLPVMKLREAARKRLGLCIAILIFIFSTAFTFSCKSSGSSSDSGIFGPADETLEAGEIVKEANEILKNIKKLYRENEGKREDLKDAMEANKTDEARKIAEEVVRLIDTGTSNAGDALKKLQEAQEKNINPDYREYLRLKESTIRLQLDAFDKYFEAAKMLRDNFDPKNNAKRNDVKEKFKELSQAYREKMDNARLLSDQANDIVKKAKQKEIDEGGT